MAGKTMQISHAFFSDVFILLTYLMDEDVTQRTRDAAARVETHAKEKISAMGKRAAFSAYKSAGPGSPEREAARQEYLALAKMHADYVSRKETTV